jgi:pSer/pThr/pTyr-binding forkhead associated (FHA) protein
MIVVTIGRNEENDIIIDDPKVSRHHIQMIQHDDGHYSLSDCGSTNGTFVNGQKISSEIPLGKNDIVRIGNTTIPWRTYFEALPTIETIPGSDTTTGV